MQREAEANLSVTSWNLNGAGQTWPCVQQYLRDEKPSALFLSEIKIAEKTRNKGGFDVPKGYTAFWNHSISAPGLHGTAWIVDKDLKPALLGMEIPVVADSDPWPELCKARSNPDDSAVRAILETEGRYLAIKVTWQGAEIALVGTYVPNVGDPDKNLPRLKHRVCYWDKALAYALRELGQSYPLLWCGDLNVAPTYADAYDMRLFGSGDDPIKAHRGTGCGTDEERTSYAKLLEVASLVETRPPGQPFTQFSTRYRPAFESNMGWNLDRILVNNRLTGTTTVRTDLDDKYKHLRKKLLARISDHRAVTGKFLLVQKEDGIKNESGMILASAAGPSERRRAAKRRLLSCGI